MPPVPDSFDVQFQPSGRGKAQCDPNPDYPEGIDLDASLPGRAHCKVPVPYPAPECGMWAIRCKVCALTVAITAAGRPDDPRSVTVPCQPLPPLPSNLTRN